MGLLAATEQAPLDRLGDVAAIGEVALDGALRGTRGTLSLAECLWRSGCTQLVCAAEAAPEAALVEGLHVHAAQNLNEAVAWLRGETLSRASPADPDPQAEKPPDLSDVRGQEGGGGGAGGGSPSGAPPPRIRTRRPRSRRTSPTCAARPWRGGRWRSR